MAAFAQASQPQTPSRSGQSHMLARSFSSHNSLPGGACNFRDLGSGANAPTCGCKRFWCTQPAATNDDANNLACICGHHACFHDIIEPGAALSFGNAATPPLGSLGQLIEVRPGVYFDVSKSQDRSGAVLHEPIDPEALGRTKSMPAPTKQSWLGPGQVGLDNGKQSVRDFATRPGDQRPPSGVQHRDTTDALRPGFSSVPSMCFLNSDDRKPLPTGACNDGTDTRPEHRSKDIHDAPQKTSSGLGLSMHSMADRLNNACLTSFYPEGQQQSFQQQREPSLAPTIQYSTDGEEVGPRPSPSQTFIDHVLRMREVRRHPDVQHAVPPDELIPSSTEVATPTTPTTPDLKTFEQAIHAAGTLTGIFGRDVADDGKEDAGGEQTRKTPNSWPNAALNPNRRHSYTADPGNHVDTADPLRDKLILRKLAQHFDTMHKHLTGYPNVSSLFQQVMDRLNALENASFYTIPAEEINEKFEWFDGRLVELEYRTNDNDRLQTVVDADYDKGEDRVTRRRRAQSSFSDGSNGGNSTQERLESLEQRVEDIESSALPSPTSPWEIEVVLLPWGRELKGIWLSPDEDFGNSLLSSQASDESSRKRTTRSPSKTTKRLTSAVTKGWTDPPHHVLVPKAAGRHGYIYNRLKSRGLVRKVTLRSNGACNVMKAIIETFGETLEILNEASTEGSASETDGYHGLSAPLIPLRKVHRENRLEFLTYDEMVTPAVWTADFLKSSVLMRAPGGFLRRLYVTQRDGYLQNSDAEMSNWTWQRIKKLPRVHLPEDNQYRSRSRMVEKADLLEACWNFNPNLDPPYSEVSSLNSQQSCLSQGSEDPSASFASNQLSLRPAPHQKAMSEPTGPVRKQLPTPQTESVQRASPFRRTISPLVFAEELSDSTAQTHRSKRPMTASFENEKASQGHPGVPAPPYSSTKRRRTVRPPDASSGAKAGPYGFTPGRSKEPPSPLDAAPSSSEQHSQATADDPAQSQKKGAMSFAYATPHSGPAEIKDDWIEGGDTEPDSASESDADETNGKMQEMKEEADSWSGSVEHGGPGRLQQGVVRGLGGRGGRA
ncbi:uncharacterized protein K452DRAFT_282173 [Aplosporella prunicola CBS 121167]|uniref:Uncharacterized protein n=1 Tax=Aplosporella prunicola CBS 121167 TaxID=1176127 RepID=A0A6A6BV41_9PEZI|nr:uncharacterized protein K452DRAFT_282173 [Aplosporella prunicola CBS 121167]KAF2147193.1 hypothetical protein K452DRAFT_282173 [Aplosporella prunicola CBS 121167]